MFETEGKEFRLFWDMDRKPLQTLSFEGRANWLRHRLNFTLLKPIEAIVDTGEDVFAWLAVTELVCAGIDALSGFYGDKRLAALAGVPEQPPFCRFVYAFMHSDFSREILDSKGKNRMYCEHLYMYFRGGLAHGFGIEWGGLWNANTEGLEGYLRPNFDGQGVAICPRAFLTDFRQAVGAYFQKLIREGENSTMGRNFRERFETILQQSSKKY